MAKQYEHIFFDLDHTLWDFDTNSKLALAQIFEEEGLKHIGVSSFEKFHEVYLPINNRYWARYHHQAVSKEKLRVGRFFDTLAAFKINDVLLAERIAKKYTDISPKMTALFPEAFEVLQYLQAKYQLHLITNGFAEVQWIKLEHSGLNPFFEHIIISDEVGTQKPDIAIFELAMQRANTTAEKSVMIGDNYSTDIVGAKNAGMDQIFFNPYNITRKGTGTYEIAHLSELKNLL